MNWLLIVLFLIALYGIIAGYIRWRRVWEDRITFYGPIMMIKSTRIGFFDLFIRFRSFLRLYSSAGVAVVVLISVLITIMLFLSLQYTLIIRPPPTGIYEPQNILLLPGINEYIPSTFAVWFAFILTIAVHEFGHGILCRVEGIAVKSIGVILAVIPIGFFVEPDEQQLEETRGVPKVRMFGAGITNNLVVGFASFFLMLLVFSAAVPVADPIIHGVYQGYPAEIAGIPPNSVIRAINGQEVSTTEDVSRILNSSQPGDQVSLRIEHEGSSREYSLTLSEWPNGTDPSRTSGFMGVYYYPAEAVSQMSGSLASPVGLLQFIAIPFDMSAGGRYLRVLAFDSVEANYFSVPFPQFWGLVHLLFWSAWININVGIFNAIPMVPLDGGYIMKEGVNSVLRRRGLLHLSSYIVGGISWVMLTMMIGLMALPYLLNL
jgi:membrane-associated protease RseP (regulator of RpoE activity)